MKGAIKILVASMSGTAEMVADEVASKLEKLTWEVEVVRMDDFSPADLKAGVYLICTSTYGTGEIPDNGKAFYDGLKSSNSDLKAVRYGVIGLGDSVYNNTFCFGGKHFDELFLSLGAKRVGDVLQHDRRSGEYPEDAALEWLPQWLELLVQEDKECLAS
ncbi:flavodoxin domain-containing protein [Pseudomonas guariconensis]|uniref:flavodoxin domain-containing protein n=1 Tax=Pseudomonas guariconensis TaxID=1288410 RepID=UPI0018AB2FE4|nr:flavodoxin domain-containing protein [Pseudomonas guariconensis]MBF8721776.1 flavodoxin domain-containing protein [Pseudomonas guariconensis]